MRCSGRGRTENLCRQTENQKGQSSVSGSRFSALTSQFAAKSCGRLVDEALTFAFVPFAAEVLIICRGRARCRHFRAGMF